MTAQPTPTDNDERDESDPPVMLASEPVSFAPPCGLYGEVVARPPKPN